MYKINFLKLFLFAFITIIASSCDDHNHDEEGHTDAEGFIFEDANGNEIYRQLEGEITGSIALNVDGILELSVHFLDHDGNEIEHEDGEHEQDELSFEITNSDVISIVAEDHEDEGGDNHEHELAFELVGMSSGTTTFTFSLMHGDHADYVSLPISVTVNSEIFSCNGKQLCLNNYCTNTMYAAK